MDMRTLRLKMPFALFALQQTIHEKLEADSERLSWEKALINALPDNTSAELDNRIRRHFAQTLLTDEQYGLKASLGDEPLPAEIADIIALINKVGKQDITPITYIDAAVAAQEALPRSVSFVTEEGRQEEIRHLIICAAADFAWHFADPSDRDHMHLTMATTATVSAACKRGRSEAAAWQFVKELLLKSLSVGNDPHWSVLRSSCQVIPGHRR